MEAVKQNGLAIRYADRTPEIRKEAIKQNGEALRYISDPGYYESLEAIKQDWRNLGYIRRMYQHPDLCMYAVKQNGLALGVVDVERQNIELCLAAVKNNGLALRFVVDRYDKICRAAVQQNGLALKYVPYKDNYIYDAIESGGNCIMFIEHPSDELLKKALLTAKDLPKARLSVLSKNGMFISNLVNPTEEECMVAVRQNGLALEKIKNRSKDVCLLAIRQNPDAIKFIENPTQEMIDLAESLSDIDTLEYETEAITGSFSLNSKQVLLLNGVLINIRRMLVALKQKGVATLYEEGGVIYLETSEAYFIKGQSFRVEGLKLNEKALKKADLFIEKTVKLLVEKVPIPVKKISFKIGVTKLTKGDMHGSESEEGSIEVVLK